MVVSLMFRWDLASLPNASPKYLGYDLSIPQWPTSQQVQWSALMPLATSLTGDATVGTTATLSVRLGALEELGPTDPRAPGLVHVLAYQLVILRRYLLTERGCVQRCKPLGVGVKVGRLCCRAAEVPETHCDLHHLPSLCQTWWGISVTTCQTLSRMSGESFQHLSDLFHISGDSQLRMHHPRTRDCKLRAS